MFCKLFGFLYQSAECIFGNWNIGVAIVNFISQNTWNLLAPWAMGIREDLAALQVLHFSTWYFSWCFKVREQCKINVIHVMLVFHVLLQLPWCAHQPSKTSSRSHLGSFIHCVLSFNYAACVKGFWVPWYQQNCYVHSFPSWFLLHINTKFVHGPHLHLVIGYLVILGWGVAAYMSRHMVCHL